jgi:ABC-type iron transport system FetAB ATPase subunit
MRKLKNNELGRITVAAFKAVQKTPIIVILDNIGSVFRTSDAFLIEKFIYEVFVQRHQIKKFIKPLWVQQLL